ncbi:MAG: sodium:proton antiporter [Erysipelotrichaceae bacterium]|nr:sodium:proton antiporter [Erysipelotrichaceae bacterium]
MELVQNFPFACIILTMFVGVLCAVLKPKTARTLAISAMVIVGILSFATLSFVVKTGEYYVYMMGHFPAPFGNEIRIGVLEALMAFIFSIVMILSLLGGMKHIFHDIEDTKVNHNFLMMCLLFSSMLALIYTNDLFTAYVFVEINTLASCAIVMLRKAKETLVATTRYLIMSLLGSGLFLIGICILYDITGHLLMSNIQTSVANLVATGAYRIPLEIIICLFVIGMAIKSALYPFHSWLPDAHGSATSSASAILSGLVVKSYIILLIKICYRVIGIDVIYQSQALNVLFVLGLIAMIMGSVNALREKDLKRMIAYSSVAQLGYIYMGIGLGSEAGMIAACFHILTHAVTKPMLFCAAGGFMEVSGGSKKFKDIRGAGRRNLLAGIAFVVGTLSMVGIPFTSGFVSKMCFAEAALGMSSKMIPTLVVLSISTLLNALYYIPAIMVVFANTGDEVTLFADKKDVAFMVSMIVFMALNFVLGCGSGKIIDMITQGIRMLG